MATGHPLLHQIEFNPKLVRRENRVGNNAVQHAEEFQEVGNDSDPQTWISPTLLRNLSRAGRAWRRMVGKRNEMAFFQIELHPRIIVFKIIIISTKIIYICVYACIYIYIYIVIRDGRYRDYFSRNLSRRIILNWFSARWIGAWSTIRAKIKLALVETSSVRRATDQPASQPTKHEIHRAAHFRTAS